MKSKKQPFFINIPNDHYTTKATKAYHFYQPPIKLCEGGKNEKTTDLRFSYWRVHSFCQR